MKEKLRGLAYEIEEKVMLGNRAVDAQLSRSLGLTMKDIEPILACLLYTSDAADE